MRRTAIVASLAALMATAAAAQTFIGVGRAIDGDTIKIRNVTIRLHGIDAPEGGQTCDDAKGQPYDCGDTATKALVGLLDSTILRCETRGEDVYKRTLAVCYPLLWATSINTTMVREGHARAFVRYSRDYLVAESEARLAKRGMWQGAHIAPWEYRQALREASR